MNIFIDVRLCSYGYQGIKTYIENILPYFFESDHTFFLAGFKNYVDNYRCYKNIVPIYYEAPINSVGEQILGIKLKKKLKGIIDVYFFPYPSVPITFLTEDCVVKFHDINPFRFWYFYNPVKVLLGYYVMKIISIRAKKIIATTKVAANDISKYFNVKASKISVIYDGVSKDFVRLSREVIENFKEEKKLNEYVLYVGNREHVKNIFKLLEALKMLRQKKYKFDFIVVGRKFKKYERMDRKILSYGDWVRIFYDVSKEDLVKFYNAAKLYVHPALNEGFGLPVLEAMKCGCICVVSDIPVFNEILGKDGIYFNPYSITDIAAAIEKVINFNRDEIEKIKKRNIEIAAKFSWEESAKSLLEVFKGVKKDEKNT